jgi:hypothetical protein
MAIKDNIDDDRYQPLELPRVPKNVLRFARLFYLSLIAAFSLVFSKSANAWFETGTHSDAS